MKVRKRGYDWNVGNTKSGLTRRSHDCPKSNERSSVVLALNMPANVGAVAQVRWKTVARLSADSNQRRRGLGTFVLEHEQFPSSLSHNAHSHTNTQTHADKLLDAEEALPGGGFIPQGEASKYRRCASFQKPSPEPVLGFEK